MNRYELKYIIERSDIDHISKFVWKETKIMLTKPLFDL